MATLFTYDEVKRRAREDFAGIEDLTQRVNEAMIRAERNDAWPVSLITVQYLDDAPPVVESVLDGLRKQGYLVGYHEDGWTVWPPETPGKTISRTGTAVLHKDHVFHEKHSQAGLFRKYHRVGIEKNRKYHPVTNNHPHSLYLEVYRVPLDFDHPLNETWPPYLERITEDYQAEESHPPKGPGFQLWYEDCPITPVFESKEGLVRWMLDNGYDARSYEIERVKTYSDAPGLHF
jgi:hypothetical protein